MKLTSSWRRMTVTNLIKSSMKVGDVYIYVPLPICNYKPVGKLRQILGKGSEACAFIGVGFCIGLFKKDPAEIMEGMEKTATSNAEKIAVLEGNLAGLKEILKKVIIIEDQKKEEKK